MTADFTVEDSGDLLLRLGPMDGSETELACGNQGPERWVVLVLGDQGKLVALRMRAVADLLAASFLRTGRYAVDLDTDEDVVDLSFGAPAMTARSVECALPKATGEVVLYFDRSARLGTVSIFQATDALHLDPEANDTEPDERRASVPLPAPSQEEPPLEEQGIVAQISAILFEADPLEVNHEINTDEYDGEAEDIAAGLPQVTEVGSVRELVHACFVRWSSPESAGPASRYDEMAEQIWSVWQRHTNGEG